MTEALRYYTVDELRAMTEGELLSLWELVPTERQRRYRTVYEREVRGAGAIGSDALESRVTDELLTRYITTALVPIGMRWTRTPARIQEAAKQGKDLVTPESQTFPAPSKSPALLLIGAGVVFAVMAFLVLPRFRGHGADTADLLSLTATATVTPGRSMTPTPIALEEQDPVIRGGDTDRAVAYPINLRVQRDESEQPRVFVMQRRIIGTAEWNFDTNPDTASYIAGLTVRPVIGVPWSPDNAALFADVSDSMVFTLQMNTGAQLRFSFDARREVSRSDTEVFRQVAPGLVLVLIGERDVEDVPTATRTVILANYMPDGELSRDNAIDALLPTVTATGTPLSNPSVAPYTGLDVQIISVETSPDRVTIRCQLYNGSDRVLHIGQDTIWIIYGYRAKPQGPRLLSTGLVEFDLMPGQAAQMTVYFPWNGEPDSVLGIGDHEYSVEFR
jgi:hypothetical protein